MKNLIFFGIIVFIFYGFVHDFFGNSDLIATVATSLLLLVVYLRQKSLKENRPNKNSTEFLIKDKDSWEKTVFDDQEISNSPGHKQANAEKEISEAKEVLDDWYKKPAVEPIDEEYEAEEYLKRKLEPDDGLDEEAPF